MSVLKDYVLLLLLTGQRRGNIESLRWSHIDFHNNTIYDPSDGKIVGTNIVKNTAKEFAGIYRQFGKNP